MLYNNTSLINYCNENNISLLEEYSKIKINRDSQIKGNCINKNCNEIFCKTFRQLIKTKAFCYDCSKQNGKNKNKENCKFNSTFLMNFCNENNIILDSEYTSIFINRDTIITGNCLTENCTNKFSKSFRELIKLNGYCSHCSKEIGKHKIIETNIKKYGCKYSMQNEEVKLKQKNKIIEIYGVDHISKLDSIKNIKKEKSLEKYGTEYVLQSSEVREKIKNTNIERYGVENPQQNKNIKEKTMTTNIKIYGCKTATNNPYIKEKIISNNLEKYGVPHHSQNPYIADKMFKKAYNNKIYILPSGKSLYYQGYENFALDELLQKENIMEEDIITNRKDVPEIWYNDKNNIKRRHYVDFYIKSQNRCIEVKSTWTNQEKNNVFEKQKAAIILGYKYEIWIFDRNGKKIETY